MKKSFIYLLSPLLVIGLLTGCQTSSTSLSENNPNETPTLKVVTTFPPLYSFTKQVVGDLASVENLVPAGTSIHTWEPKPSVIKKIAEADAFVMNGLNLEAFGEDLIKAGNTDLKVIVTSEAVKDQLLEFKHEDEHHEEDEDHHDDEHEDEHGHEEDHEEDEHHHDHEGPDPHIWLDPTLAIQQIEYIRDQIIALDGKNEAIYQKNTQSFIDEIKSVDQEIKTIISNIKPKNFIVFHDAYRYFFTHYNLTEFRKASVEPFPGKEPSPRYLKDLLDTIKNNDVNVVYTEPQFSPKLIETLKQEVSIKSYEMDPIGSEVSPEGYLKNLRNLAKTLEESLK